VFEGNGRVSEYVGGYQDWLRQRPAPPAPEGPPTRLRAGTEATARMGPAGSVGSTPTKRRLSFNEQREFLHLPERIDALELEARDLNAAVAHPEFYKEGAAAIARTLARVEEVQRELDEAYARWVELEPRSH